MEIKEILDFKENADYKKLSCDEIAILKDYITNLQQRIEKAVEYINENIVDIDFVKENYNIENFSDFDISIKNVEDLLNILNGKE